MNTQVLALLVVSALSPVAAVAQQPTAAAAPAATRAGTLPIPQPAAGFVQPMTPWGEPDLQGFWPGVEMVGVPLQRPASLIVDPPGGRQPPLFEYACHEGNYALRNILSASRVAEANGSK